MFLLTAAKPVQVVVDEAIPESAEQGTLSLVVRIKGSGFEGNASVAFWRTGTTNPGGVSVTKVAVISATEIDVIINVALDAVIDDYDIQVQVSKGRKGRGTTLFSVKQKGGGPTTDTTPPALIEDFRTDRVTSDSISLYWTAPGDDGEVGTADYYALRQAEQLDPSICAASGPYDFTNFVDLPAPAPREAGRGHELEANGLNAATCYAFEIQPFDEAGNTPGPSQTSGTTQSATIEGAWTIEESVPGAYWDALFFDPISGQPVVLTADGSLGHRHYTRSSDGTWSSQKVGKGKGSGNISFAYDPGTNTYGGVIRGNHTIYVELQADGSWSTQLIIRDSVGLRRQGFAFDSNHMPAVAYRNDGFVYLARYNGSSFDIEQLPVSPSDDPSLRFHPITHEPVIIYPANGGIHIATKVNDSWENGGESLSIPNDLWGPALLAFDRNNEMVILFKEELRQPFDQWIRMIRRDASGNWDYNLAVTIDPDGIINQQHPSLVFADDGTLYVAMGNVGRQARVGRFCEEGRTPAFPCETSSPTRDVNEANVWYWETAAEDAYTSGGGDVSIAIDDANSTVAIVSPGMRYLSCNPLKSIICGSAPVP